MKFHLKNTLLVILLCNFFNSAISQNQNGVRFYISNSGDDANPGTVEKPFKSISKVNTLQLKPGGAVFFKAGETFDGTISLLLRGTMEDTIFISSYGNGRAIINGGSTQSISLGGNFFKLSNINAKGAGRKTGNTTVGVQLIEAEHALVDNILTEGFQKIGLYLYNCKYTTVRNVFATENGFAGIYVEGTRRDSSKNILITECRAENNPGDPTNLTNHSGNGILVAKSDSVVIEHCTATNNGWDMPRIGNGPVGIWAYESDHITIQNCVSYRNKTAKNAKDGGGFDLDGGVTNSIIQNCLSFENAGAGFGLFQYYGASPWKNNIVRNCISYNDATTTEGSGGIFVWSDDPDSTHLSNCSVYKNLIYNIKAPVIVFEEKSLNTEFKFYKNLFVGTGNIITGPSSGERFEGNIWQSSRDGLKFRGYASLQDWANATGQEISNGKLVGTQEDTVTKRALAPLFDSILSRVETFDFHSPRKINVSGKWKFNIDSLDQGIQEKWFSKELADSIILPGSMLTNGKGNEITVATKWTGGIWDSTWYKSPDFAKYREPGKVKVPFWLQPLKYYVGQAWYQKKIDIPIGWGNKYIQLFLERAHWETKCWIDDRFIGMQNALSAPQYFNLNFLTPGEHTITLCIDNRIKEINPGYDAHSVTDNTQTNWNGIIGSMYLVAKPEVNISQVNVFPDVDKNIATVEISINNVSGVQTDCNLQLQAVSKDSSQKHLPSLGKSISIKPGESVFNIVYGMGKNWKSWDEFNPNLSELKVNVGNNEVADSTTVQFGMRKLETRGTQFFLNGRQIFFRGTLECAIFPQTGFPSTAEKDWERIIKICRDHGLNHIRFHSWCPPEAAFEVADRYGFYLSIECSAWANVGSGKPIDQYIYDESKRIVAAYGNHPSFCLMPYGNEASGDNAQQYLTEFVKYWKAKDNRRLYTSASGFPDSPASDYTSSGAPRIQWWGAGLTSPINANPPTTDFDWTQYIEKNKPTISHEIGQWCVYPDFSEMKKYAGVLKPKNFEIFWDKLNEHGMANLADSFLLASGILQVLCYKADIEAALRTPGFGGFQLLDLHDFPGQGTALVGVLNPFWDEKKYSTAKEYKKFCNETVPLLRVKKLIYNNNEALKGKIEISHFGKGQLKKITPNWKITYPDGKLFSSGKLATTDIEIGLATLGNISVDLSAIKKPERLIITVSTGSFENSWDVFVYPARVPVITNDDIYVTQVLDRKAEQLLQKGGKVLLTSKKGSVKADKGGSIPIGFSSIFWNTQWTEFKQPPFSLGILCDPKNSALAAFPTQYHSNWQWWDAMTHSNVFRLDSIDKKLKPIVRVIDDWFTSRPLGLIFECKVGKGKLLVSGIDLISDQDKRPEARQLLYSLKKYMASAQFNPSVKLDIQKIQALYEK